MKLIGYSVFNKRQVGFQNAHEVIQDDFVALHINEVEGGVISNNAAANGLRSVARGQQQGQRAGRDRIPPARPLRALHTLLRQPQVNDPRPQSTLP